MTDFTYTVSNKPPTSAQGQIDTAWLKARTINHTVNTDYLLWPTAPGIQRHTYNNGSSGEL